MRRYAVSGYLIVLAMSLLALSCGTIRSVSAIRDADKARDEALRRIAVTFQDSRITVKDTYGRESLSKEAATFVEKKEDREPLYLFYVADGLLIKARDLQSKSEHERACELAEKSLEISGKSLNALKTVGAAGPAKEAAVPASGIAVLPPRIGSATSTTSPAA